MAAQGRYKQGRGAHPERYGQYHNVIVAAATPQHFEHLVQVQGGWTPPQPGRAAAPLDTLLGDMLDRVPEGVRDNLAACCSRWHSAVSARYARVRAFADVQGEVSRFMRRFCRGIYVCVRGGRVVIYQPFSAAVHDRHVPDHAVTDVAWREIQRKVKQRWWAQPSRWYVNHCWVDAKERSVQTPTEWWTTEYLAFFMLLEHALPPGTMPDADLIINNSDFPVVHVNDRHPPGLPVLSAVQHADYLDIPLPTTDDIEYVTQRVFLHLPSAGTCRDLYLTPFDTVPWERRAPTAVFRGSASGCGVTVAANPRVQLAKLAQDLSDSPARGGAPLLDAGITDYNETTPRLNNGRVDIIDPGSLGVPLLRPIPLHQQSRYRYMVNVEGYVGAFRYLFMLSSGSMVINVDCAYKMWYEPAIVPGDQVLQVRAVADVPAAVRWAREHDNQARETADRARALHQQLSSPECMAAYMALLLRALDWGSTDLRQT